MLIGRCDDVMKVTLEMGRLGVQFAGMLDEVRQIDCALRKDLFERLALLLQPESQLPHEVQLVKVDL